MKRLFLMTNFMLGLVVISGCYQQDESLRQGAYYDNGTEDSNIIYGPVFVKYEACKDRAIGKKGDAYNSYVYCSKNCHDSISGTPICEEIVRSWSPLALSNTFDNYKK